jgi:hypothetical protein
MLASLIFQISMTKKKDSGNGILSRMHLKTFLAASHESGEGASELCPYHDSMSNFVIIVFQLACVTWRVRNIKLNTNCHSIGLIMAQYLLFWALIHPLRWNQASSVENTIFGLRTPSYTVVKHKSTLSSVVNAFLGYLNLWCFIRPRSEQHSALCNCCLRKTHLNAPFMNMKIVNEVGTQTPGYLFYIIYRIYLFLIYRIEKNIFFTICIENCEWSYETHDHTRRKTQHNFICV